ncbi:MAG TPA: hypothetical protein VFT46_02175 [Holophagaceae bacterium]|nr:hypothetical protein [Holophagaceae bacterium]
MAEVAICSLVRDGMDYLPSYRRQLESLRLGEGDSWRLYILEGDSRDGSREFLLRWASEDPRIQVGQEQAGDASDQEDRAARWARVGNACFGLIPADSTHTHVLWLEADLCFPPELVERLLSRQVDIVAPVIFLGGMFYDTWGFRDLEGRRWTNDAPYHPEYRPFDMMEMGSVGSCVLFRRAILDAGIRFKGTYDQGLLVGMCQDARSLGFRVWADTGTAILHPMTAWEEQMWRPSRIWIESSEGGRSELAVPEARAMGLQVNLPLLDAQTYLKIQAGFWRTLFRRWGTTRLDAELVARAYPKKTYELAIRILPPRGLGRWAFLRRCLIGFMRPRRISLRPEAGGASGAWLRGGLACRLALTLKESR